MGDGPDTTTWLGTYWHLGPPLFALPYAIMEGGRRPPQAAPERAGRIRIVRGWRRDATGQAAASG